MDFYFSKKPAWWEKRTDLVVDENIAKVEVSKGLLRPNREPEKEKEKYIGTKKDAKKQGEHGKRQLMEKVNFNNNHTVYYNTRSTSFVTSAAW